MSRAGFGPRCTKALLFIFYQLCAVLTVRQMFFYLFFVFEGEVSSDITRDRVLR